MHAKKILVLAVALAIAASNALTASGSTAAHASSNDAWFDVSVAPNGQLVSFVVFNGDCGSLMVISIDGSNERQLSPKKVCVSQTTEPVFSPDGSKLLYGVAPNSKYGQGTVTLALDTVSVSSGKVSQVVKTPWDSSDRSAIWSPDGKSIAYVHDDHYANKCQGCIFVRRLSQAKPKWAYVSLQPGGGGGGVIDQLAWSPNGAWIAFDATTTNPHDNGDSVFRIRPDGRDKKQLTHGITVQGDLSWTRDSSTIAYAGGGTFEIRTVNVSGSVHKVVIRASDGNGVTQPVFSPDGAQIAYEHSGLDGWYGDTVAFVANRDGTNPHSVSPTSHDEVTSLAWAPGDTIIYSSIENGIFSVPAAGGTPTLIAH